MWFGGIGIYIKFVDEYNIMVGDWVNDVICVDVNEVCVKIIGEGVNFGII